MVGVDCTRDGDVIRSVWSNVGRILAIFVLLCGIAPMQPALAINILGFKFFEGDDESADIIDPAPYSVVLSLSEADGKLLEKLQEFSLLVSKQDFPPSGAVGLISRAQDDQGNLLAQLYEEARYGGTVAIFIGGRRLEDISVTEKLRTVGGKVHVSISVDPGPEFRFGNVRISGPKNVLAEDAVREAGLVSGSRASSETILAAEGALVNAWQQAGHPFAEIIERKIVADHATRQLDVTLRARPGHLATLGAVRVEGAKRVDAEFLARQADVPYGVAYHPDVLNWVRKNLSRLDALASISTRVGKTPGPDGHLPIIIEVAERKRRTIGAGAFWSSTEGAGAEVFWVHRNFMGRAETLRLDARVGRLFEADHIDEYDGLASVLYSIPGFWGPRNRLDLKSMVLQEDPDPYNRRGVVVEGHLYHYYSDNLTVSAGLLFDWARIDDAFGRNYYSLLGVPLTAQYDTRDNALDATRGVYGRLRLEPQITLDDSAVFFTADAELRLYRALDEDGRFVVAARGLAGSTSGAKLSDIPAHRRFYAGGGGSVRGYDYLNIGPRAAGFGATGGLARIEGSLEARIKVTENIGIVPFVDAGLVTEEPTFSGDNDFQIGVGLGLRYYTSVGPVRLDVAVPLDPRSGDPDFAVYAGIGQSF